MTQSSPEVAKIKHVFNICNYPFSLQHPSSPFGKHFALQSFAMQYYFHVALRVVLLGIIGINIIKLRQVWLLPAMIANTSKTKVS